MIHLKKIVRAIGIFSFILLASFAAGISGAMLPNRERFMNNETKIEMIDRKRNEVKKREANKVRIS